MVHNFVSLVIEPPPPRVSKPEKGGKKKSKPAPKGELPYTIIINCINTNRKIIIQIISLNSIRVYSHLYAHLLLYNTS